MKKQTIGFSSAFNLVLVLFVTGCSVHAGTSAGTGAGSGDQAGVSDNVASLAYDFKVDNYCEGMCTDPESNEHCETSQSFDSQSDYCHGLEDVGLNKGCAHADRMNQYAQDCGSDFHDIDAA